MKKEMTVSFPGNKRVDVHWGNMIAKTDQRKAAGGDESAPQPFDLFFVSLASCAGISALEYCTEHSLPTEGLGVRLIAERPKGERRYTTVRVEVTPPADFPADHLAGLLQEADDCSVKRHIQNPPAFETVLAT